MSLNCNVRWGLQKEVLILAHIKQADTTGGEKKKNWKKQKLNVKGDLVLNPKTLCYKTICEGQ